MSDEIAAFQPASATGSLNGLENLMRMEFRRWWKTGKWWLISLVFTVLINLILAGEAFYEGSTLDSVLMIFATYTGLLPLPGVIIVMQDVIVGERLSGTILWIMSKPVTRSAFILAKFIPNMINILVTMILFPGMVAYFIIGFSMHAWLPLFNCAGAVLVIGLYYMFYVALILCLSAFFSKRGVIIAVPVAFAFCQQFLVNLMPFVFKLMPWTLTIPINDEAASSVVVSILLGGQIAWSTVISVSAASIFLLYAAIWKFKRVEF